MLRAAEGAFRYEQRCYSPEHRNWPDFRGLGEPGPHTPAETPAVVLIGPEP